VCLLYNVQKRRLTAPDAVRVYQIASHCAEAAGYLVAKAVKPQQGHGWTLLDRGGCFLLHMAHQLYVWQGSDCPQEAVKAGIKAAWQLVRYESAPQPVVVKQGECGGWHLLLVLLRFALGHPAWCASCQATDCLHASSAVERCCVGHQQAHTWQQRMHSSDSDCDHVVPHMDSAAPVLSQPYCCSTC